MLPDKNSTWDSRLATMTSVELSEWLRNVLKGSSVVQGGPRDEASFAAIARVYGIVSAPLQARVLDVVLEALGGGLEGGMGSWKPPELDSLLLLGAALAPLTSEPARRRLLQGVLYYSGAGAGVTSAIQDRALSLLPTMGFRGDVDFWTRVGDERPERRARIAIRGLAGIGCKEAFSWAAAPNSPPERAKALAPLIPWFVDTFGVGPVQESLEEVWKWVPLDLRADIAFWAGRVGLNTPVSVPDLPVHDVIRAWTPSSPMMMHESILQQCINECAPDDPYFEDFLGRLARSAIGGTAVESDVFRALFAKAAEKLNTSYLNSDKGFEINLVVAHLDSLVNDPRREIEQFIPDWHKPLTRTNTNA